jgi:AcrR family transcriptional regulator
MRIKVAGASLIVTNVNSWYRSAMGRQPSKKPRIRRSPEVARALILDAAKQVLADKGPGQTGLVAVAKVAGVSHSLVAHYFGTVDALVEEVIEQHMGALRESILSGLQAERVEPDTILEMVFEALSDRLQGRLMAWVLLSGRAENDAFFAREAMGLRRITDLLIGSARPSKKRRRDLENRLVLLWCAAVGYGAGASVLWDSLGVEHTAQRDAEFRQLISDCLNVSAST